MTTPAAAGARRTRLDRIRTDAFEKVLVGNAPVDDAAVDIVDESVSNEDGRDRAVTPRWG